MNPAVDPAVVTPGGGDMALVEVRVNEGTRFIDEEDREWPVGSVLRMNRPQAENLALLGHVTIVS